MVCDDVSDILEVCSCSYAFSAASDSGPADRNLELTRSLRPRRACGPAKFTEAAVKAQRMPGFFICVLFYIIRSYHCAISPLFKTLPVCGPRPGFRVAVLHDLFCAYRRFLGRKLRLYRWNGQTSFARNIVQYPLGFI